MEHKLSLLFFIKSSKANKNGAIPIYIRITVNGTRFEISTARSVEKSKWIAKSGKVKGTSEETRLINGHLDYWKNRIFETEKKMLLTDEEINAQTFKNKLLGIEEKQHKLIPIFQSHNNRMKELIDKEFSINTYKKYVTAMHHIQEFLKENYKVNDIDIKKIKIAFINDFDFFLRNTKNCNNNSTIKYIRNFGKIVKQCYVNGWIEKDPFVNYRGKVKEKERAYLSEQEIEALNSKTFVAERLNLVRDIFVFSCFTGLAYIDVQQLSPNNIAIGIDGDKWIFKNRQKTDTESKIPLLPIALDILQKYEDHPQCLNQNKLLPILSNQKMNAYLKEIADLCGINKELTFHIARHTFATTVTLTNGVPIESVSKMLGHKNIRTTQHYAKVLDKKVSEDMKILKDKFKPITTVQSSKSN
jgi:site-specific recombinase XerD